MITVLRSLIDNEFYEGLSLLVRAGRIVSAEKVEKIKPPL